MGPLLILDYFVQCFVDFRNHVFDSVCDLGFLTVQNQRYRFVSGLQFPKSNSGFRFELFCVQSYTKTIVTWNNVFLVNFAPIFNKSDVDWRNSFNPIMSHSTTNCVWCIILFEIVCLRNKIRNFIIS